MESILARALEYTLKYWLKSFSREQFKLQGRTAQLSNLELDGDALHASVGFPPALNVTTARVGKLEITLPPVSYVQTEPILVQIDRLDLVLEENADACCPTGSSSASAPVTSKGVGYGFADKIADGMTLEVSTVNLLLETHGSSRQQGGATWTSPLASITIRNLLLYTTNENWQVVNLKEARDFSHNKNFIYVFKKLEWASLSLDLLPHPDMFVDARLSSSTHGGDRRDDDGAKRVFFGGERFLDGIAGQAYITIQRTEHNTPSGLEVRLHLTEVVCPSLSEPGLRAFLRFMTGLYVCVNRGDVDPKSQKCCTEAPGRSIVSIIVDHIFLCVKDAGFQLELLMQSLSFSRASVSDGEIAKNLSCIMVGGLILRDTFVYPPCTLIQPSMQTTPMDFPDAPLFSKNFCPPIYPLGDQQWKYDLHVPLLSLHSLQFNPSPAPPSFASETFITCQPLVISLQEESCFRISSFLADGIVVGPGVVLRDHSIKSLVFTLKEFDLIVPIYKGRIAFSSNGSMYSRSHFSGARLHVEDLCFSESPSIKCSLLNLEKDPACFGMCEYQPIDASQRKWVASLSHISILLENTAKLDKEVSFVDPSSRLWRCVELQEVCLEAAMVTADGSPLLRVPPAEGVVRIGFACEKYSSNTSVEQLFFVLDLCNYLGEVSESIGRVNKARMVKGDKCLGENLTKNIPGDTGISLAVNCLSHNFLESSEKDSQGISLVHFDGHNLVVKVSHRTLGGAFAMSSYVNWEIIHIDCVDGEELIFHGKNTKGDTLVSENGYPHMRAVVWIDHETMLKMGGVPFLEITAVHVMPYDVKDMECYSLNISAKISAVCLGGGMSYTENLLHRFGILGPDGYPGEGISRVLKNLSSGQLAKLFKASHVMDSVQDGAKCLEDNYGDEFFKLGIPDDVDLSLELNDWLFALEGARDVERQLCEFGIDSGAEERCWHATFRSLKTRAKSNQFHNLDGIGKNKSHKMLKYPIESITVSLDGLRACKPRTKGNVFQPDLDMESFSSKYATIRETSRSGGVDMEACLTVSEDRIAEGLQWAVEKIKFSVKHPMEAVVSKVELEHLFSLCQSEVDSMGRIVVGVLHLLKLDKSVGLAALDHLNNLGSGSFGRVLAPEKLSRHSSVSSSGFSFSPYLNNNNTSTPQSLESIISSLDAEISDSQSECSLLLSELNKSLPDLSPGCLLDQVQILSTKLENMQTLLAKLRTQSQLKL